MVAEKVHKIRVVLNVVIAADSNIGKKEQEKIGNYQRLKEHLEQMWKSKAIPVVIRGLHPGECNPGNNLPSDGRYMLICIY